MLAKGWEDHRIYLYGDAKTVENMAKFVRDMQDRKISYSVANMQSEIFLQALTCVVELPGDWHTGMNTLQSIYSIYYTGFLDQFQSLLYWKRINKDVAGCYYQAQNLVSFVHEELMRFFVHQFVSERQRTTADDALTDAQIVSKVNTEFMQFLVDLKSSNDKWISTCAHFLEMSYDFLEFAEAYRIGDSISIEFGYQKHAPVWQAVGQHKYVEIFYGQQESLYRDIAYSRLQEIRINRVVRRYHANTGKRCVAHDEFLEHGNRFFSNFPVPKTLISFAFQSNYVGIGLMCKRHTDLWCSASWKGGVPHNYKPHVKPIMTPEKRLLYQVFAKLSTHIADNARVNFNKAYVSSVKSKLTIDLKRSVLGNSMSYSTPTSANDILKSITGVFETVHQFDPLAEGELEAGEIVNVPTAAPLATIPEDTPLVVENFTKAVMSPLFFDDPWAKGRATFAEKDILAIRVECVRRLVLKSRVRRCILNGIEDMVTSSESVVVGMESDVRPESWSFVRSMPNNLGL